jgi:hypothetical protein
MKFLIIFFPLIFAFQAPIIAQQTDENKFIINEYFRVIEENPTIKKPLSANSDIASYVNLMQTGRDNNIYIKSLQTGDNQVINQVGYKNNYEYYNFYSTDKSSLSVNQEGILNSLQIFGENSLMKDAVINQKSDFKSVIIKNYTN